MTISNELLDELLKGCKRLDALLGEPSGEAPAEQANRRNGISTNRATGPTASNLSW